MRHDLILESRLQWSVSYCVQLTVQYRILSVLHWVQVLRLLQLYGSYLGSDPLQFGFKKNSSCSSALFTFTEAIKYCNNLGSKVYSAFLDASKAFDKVLHNGLFLKLIKRNVPIAFVKLLKNWYSRLSCMSGGTANWVLLSQFCAAFVKGEYYHHFCLPFMSMTWSLASDNVVTVCILVTYLSAVSSMLMI